MPKQARQQGAHRLDEAFKDFVQSYPREIVYPIFGLLKRVVLCFPVLESEEAISAFVWVVGKHQTQTVAKEQASIATRSRSPERLKLPVLRALRQTRDFYFDDVRDHANDDVAQRIPRWGKEVQTLPVFGKIDTPHPVTVAWEYDSIKHVCECIRQDAGFSGWTKFAKEKIPGGQGGTIPFPLWPRGEEPITIDVPENATAEQAAYAFLHKTTRLSVDHLKKLIYQGNRFFPDEVSIMLRERWKAVDSDKDKLQHFFDSIDAKRLPDESDDERDDRIESFGTKDAKGVEIESLLKGLPFTLDEIFEISKLLKSKKKK